MIMRKDVDPALTWDLSSIYKTEEDMYRDAEKMKEMAEAIEKEYRGRLDSPERIAECMDLYREVYTLSVLTGNYCDLAVSVDYYDTHNQDRNDRISRLIADIFSRLSFIRTELSALDTALLEKAGEISPGNRLYLMDIVREKPHMLSPETERVLAALSPSMEVPYQIYNMAKLADMKFPPFEAGGKEYPLGYSIFEDDYEYEKDTEIRRKAFRAFSKKLRDYENVTAAAYNARVQSEKAESTVRGYQSVFDFLLFPQKVTEEMYHRQIDLIMEHLAPHMRRYARLLQKIYGLDRMTFADLKIAVDPDFAPRISIHEAGERVAEGLSILGEDYTDMVREAFRDRWIDFASNQGKSTGGFCASPYGKNSFILFSWNGRMSDVFTLAHELGHAGHFKLCNEAQSIFDTDVSTYFVEAPSTMNELILAHYLLKTNPDRRFRRWVISSMVGDTYFHNFVTHLLEAAYQREVYQIVDQGGSVSADKLSAIMKDTLKKFWGDAVEIDDDAALTWMRQPHYYMGLYPYTYSAGLTIATQVCRRIETEGAPAVEDWKRVLSAGSTKDPAELAAMAGIDITTDGPLLDTIAYVGSLIDEIEALTEELESGD